MIKINGESKEGFEGKTLIELLEECGYAIGTVVVECNEEIIPRDALSQHTTKEGDQIEVIRFVGGGSTALVMEPCKPVGQKEEE